MICKTKGTEAMVNKLKGEAVGTDIILICSNLLEKQAMLNFL
jgi:hypothetical protein